MGLLHGDQHFVRLYDIACGHFSCFDRQGQDFVSEIPAFDNELEGLEAFRRFDIGQTNIDFQFFFVVIKCPILLVFECHEIFSMCYRAFIKE